MKENVLIESSFMMVGVKRLESIVKKITGLQVGTILLCYALLASNASSCQTTASELKNKRWQHLDILLDDVYGISLDRTYERLSASHTRKTVIVAVVDSGTDTLHDDLKSVLWRNIKEKGKDEDNNGYMNDRYGWNFLGEKKGNIPLKAGFEYRRMYLSLKTKYGKYSESAILKSADKIGISWLSAKERFQSDSAITVSGNLAHWKRIATEDSLWRKVLGKETYVAKDIIGGKYPIHEDVLFMPYLLGQDSSRTNEQQLGLVEEAKAKLLKEISQNPKLHRAETIGDDYDNLNDKFYGDPYVNSPTSDHGTQVAGIIGAERDNGIGTDGIADNIKLMVVRAVQTGSDEYDKDVALAIRYAVDNGAKVINMSFGKPYSLQRQWVEDAIKYAAKNDVLIVHAAGNDSQNTDSVCFYPTSKYLNGRYAPNMITVGASGSKRETLIAMFSNYGKATVDVFAPGVDMYSTVNGNKYKISSGTSMAAPVVAGLAALLRSYYPHLTAVQVKDIIERSVTKIDFPVVMPGRNGKLVPMTELCRSGGIVNAYNAVLLADQLTNKKLWK